MQSNHEITVLVTGVGAIIGYGIIKSLRRTGTPMRIIGTDIYDDAVGQFWCDAFVQAPYAIDSTYIPFLAKIIEDEGVDIVFFGTEQELHKCLDSKTQLGPLYQKLVINNDNLLTLSRDKWRTREALIANGLGQYAIPSVVEGDYASISGLWGQRFILKPRSSYASKGIHIVDNEADFNFYKAEMGSNFMAQQLIGSDEAEFTVGVFGFGDGEHTAAIQMKRKLSQEGATAKAQTVTDESLEQAVGAICAAFKPLGPTNLQFRKDGDCCFLLEINPRISSSTSIRAVLGFNEAEMCLQFFLKDIRPNPTIESGFAMRYIDEVVVKL